MPDKAPQIPGLVWPMYWQTSCQPKFQRPFAPNHSFPVLSHTTLPSLVRSSRTFFAVFRRSISYINLILDFLWEVLPTCVHFYACVLSWNWIPCINGSGNMRGAESLLAMKNFLLKVEFSHRKCNRRSDKADKPTLDELSTVGQTNLLRHPLANYK